MAFLEHVVGRAIHQIGFTGDAQHRVRNDLAGFNNLKTVTFVEAACTVVFCIIDQA
jgi:hypothetical protein